MSTGWTTIKSLADWDAYRQQSADGQGIDVGQIQWGKGPLKYPCLVATYRVSLDKMIACYVYVEDAIRLLQVAGSPLVTPRSILPSETQAPPGMVAVPMGGLGGLAQTALLAQQFAQVTDVLEKLSQLHQSYKDFHRHSAANHLTVADIFINEFKGYVTPERYEQAFVRFLAFVDQHGEDKAGECLVAVKAILDQVKPAG